MMAKTIAIYWNNDSNDLNVLPDVPSVTCGNDGMEVLGPDWAIEELHQAVLAHPSQLTLASDPRPADDNDLWNVVAFSENATPHFDDETTVQAWLATVER